MYFAIRGALNLVNLVNFSPGSMIESCQCPFSWQEKLRLFRFQTAFAIRHLLWNQSLVAEYLLSSFFCIFRLSSSMIICSRPPAHPPLIFH